MPEPKQYEERDRAWKLWEHDQCESWTPRDTAIARAAFNHGWASRKKADIRLALALDGDTVR